MRLASSKAAGQNGTHVETLVLGHPSNPANLIDDAENKIEIKSCRERHATIQKSGRHSTRMGQFKINFDQHDYLIKIDGTYVFCVLDEDLGKIIRRTKVQAKDLEERFHILSRVLTKHHYYSINWTKVFQ